MAVQLRDSHLDRRCHAQLMCKLATEITEQELRNLNQVIRTSGMVPKNSIASVVDFFGFWAMLEEQALLKCGKYDVLLDLFEMLNRMDIAAIIKAHSKKIEELRRTQIRPRASTNDIADEEDDPLLDGFVVVQMLVK
ncbi:uncharacterized protein LOC135503306 [Lineus longissimus]|uniref:uncharacterized protein LOC135503306 n=1 Tax=Lineus longissimus TaxID=88925 RepID=UPI00315DCC25